tara:strand:- start:54 stop:191 length:138 start_codon:yes stop_codon:yes gene_type:complete
MINFWAGLCVGVLSVLLILVAKNLSEEQHGFSDEFMDWIKKEGTE